jgi:hypothetical protein
VQHHISVLLFIGLACGLAMLFFTRLFGATTLAGIENESSDQLCPFFGMIVIHQCINGNRAYPMSDELFYFCPFQLLLDQRMYI